MTHTPRHIPVLSDQVMAAIRPRPGQTVVDCTVGLGGHSSLLLKAIGRTGRLISLDLDSKHIEMARSRLTEIAPNFTLHHTNFAGLPKVLAELEIERVDAILADLGVASTHIDDPDRGFSYRKPGPLDMRMDPTRGQPASALLARIPQQELAAALTNLGDEEDADKIAKLVVERRALNPILTTQDLTAIVCEARDFTLKRAEGAKLHPAARTFQTLRILVNRELANLQRLLAVAPDHLIPGGTLAIISFHSGEDRIVKSALKQGKESGHYTSISPDPEMAQESEIRANPRSRSAKLRWGKRA
jgi:16S rRNA (cytosine1402-N4)-methyltransferase